MQGSLFMNAMKKLGGWDKFKKFNWYSAIWSNLDCSHHRFDESWDPRRAEDHDPDGDWLNFFFVMKSIQTVFACGVSQHNDSIVYLLGLSCIMYDPLLDMCCPGQYLIVYSVVWSGQGIMWRGTLLFEYQGTMSLSSVYEEIENRKVYLQNLNHVMSLMCHEEEQLQASLC